MNVKQLFTDDSAVSPVIGVILMVAITVILAAVIGTFVLNLGQGIQQTAPQASFGFDFDTDNQNVTITHETGDSVPSGELNATSSGSLDYAGSTTFEDLGGDISAGDAATYNNSGVWNGETVRVVWTSQDGENSATLSQSTAPGN
ncbi:type IV pilin [Halobellus sp. GM3]|uniref:type IV pilin n=1 Tax=Halobellus sp. GM3 TaxID=3458410 RepID=UPI00403D86E9